MMPDLKATATELNSPDLLAEVKALKAGKESMAKECSQRLSHALDGYYNAWANQQVEMEQLKKQLTQAEAERDALAELAYSFAEEYNACRICPANGVTCSESDCIEDLIKYAQQQAAKEGASNE